MDILDKIADFLDRKYLYYYDPYKTTQTYVHRLVYNALTKETYNESFVQDYDSPEYWKHYERKDIILDDTQIQMFIALYKDEVATKLVENKMQVEKERMFHDFIT